MNRETIIVSLNRSYFDAWLDRRGYHVQERVIRLNDIEKLTGDSGYKLRGWYPTQSTTPICMGINAVPVGHLYRRLGRKRTQDVLAVMSNGTKQRYRRGKRIYVPQYTLLLTLNQDELKALGRFP